MRLPARLTAFLLGPALALLMLPAAPAHAVDIPTDKGVIEGTITDSVTGAPRTNLCVEATLAGNEWATAYACSDAAGHFATSFLTPGDYSLAARDWNAMIYLPQTISSVPVVAGSATVRDISMVRGGSITGTVLEARTGLPLEGICADAFIDRTDGSAGSGYPCSDSNGKWTVHGLPSGTYTVQLRPQSEWTSPYVPTWVGKVDTRAKATLFTVAAGQTVTAARTKLDPAAYLSGTVTNQQGDPLEGVLVAPTGGYDGRAGWGEGKWQTQTDANGRYTVAVPAGTYTPLFYDLSGTLAPQWSGGAVTMAAGTSISVRATKTATVNAQLAPASRFQVSVVDSAGAPLSGFVAGLVYTTAGDYIGDFDAWDGNYQATALPAGTFTLEIDIYDPQVGATVAHFWYDGAATRADATPTSLGVGETKVVVAHVP